MADQFLNTIRWAHFSTLDLVRRAQGNFCAQLGFGPNEAPFKVIDRGGFWCLRHYTGDDRPAQPSLLIVAAPIKRPYIWDLVPFASAVRHCLRQSLQVYLLEWLPAVPSGGNNGIAQYVSAVSHCALTVAGRSAGANPFLIGHSLGGTLAAISAILTRDAIRGLVLLSAPLCFRASDSHFRDNLVSLVPLDLSEQEPFPGSLLTHMSALASPETFVWSRLRDAATSATDPQAMEVHARVERWALDEAALPGKLVHQIIAWLYRDNRLCRGTLEIDGVRVSPANFSAPTLAVANVTDEVAPVVSMKPFLEAMPNSTARLIEYAGDTGVALQHLAILLGREAHERVWPEIIGWVRSHA